MSLAFDGPWKKFECVVAAVHASRMSGAEVILNEKIEGREFDVSIRFKNGSHSYLTLIECKRHSRKISVDKIEAFVTKR